LIASIDSKITMTASSVPQQELANISLNDTTPTKPSELLYSGKSLSLPPFSANSLSRMMCGNRAQLRSTMRGTGEFSPSQILKPAMKKISFDVEDYGYGFAEPSAASSASSVAAGPHDVDRPAKRRKFERRNSKTPAMLMAAMQAALELDFLNTSDEEEKEDSTNKEDDDEEDNWDGGLEIAQELVKQLQQRRRSRGMMLG
jgi:hypothetical protein